MFMDTQGKGWYGGTWHGGGNEGSAGEGLSRFLGTQFLLREGQSLSLISRLQHRLHLASNPAAAKTSSTTSNRRKTGSSRVCGCAVLFIYYLFSQLGFSIEQIVGAGADQLAGVYANLTGDSSNPFPYFKQMLDVALPGTTTITSGQPGRPLPARHRSPIVGVKNTYGRDEVTNVVDVLSGQLQARVLGCARRLQP